MYVQYVLSVLRFESEQMYKLFPKDIFSIGEKLCFRRFNRGFRVR